MDTFLRPPGVVSEQELKKRCISCAQCAQVCNFDCIEMRPDSLLGGTTPKVFHYKSPCFLCMKCSEICPTGALRDVPMEQSGMGLAHLDRKICVDYQESSGIMCWTCFERCPMKGTAIVLAGGYTPTVTDACVGCGVCAYVCPTKAISITAQRHLTTPAPAAAAPDNGKGGLVQGSRSLEGTADKLPNNGERALVRNDRGLERVAAEFQDNRERTLTRGVRGLDGVAADIPGQGNGGRS